MEDNQDHIDELIGKVLSGEATYEEKQHLQQWTDSAEGNRRHVQHIETIFARSGSEKVITVDTDAAWEKVKETVNRERPSHTIFQTLWPTIRLVASVVIVVGVVMIGYRWLEPPQKLELLADEFVTQDSLPDGSTAFLNRKSSISYEYDAGQKRRIVKLKGEGFFRVKHEESKPFVIQTDGVFVEDIGTAFNVRAYPGKDTVEVVVQEGEVQIYSVTNQGIRVKAGETGFYRKSDRNFWKLDKVDPNALSYQTGIFSFNDTDLKSVIDKINEAYQYKIRLVNPALANCRLTVNFQNDSIQTIVEVIAETLKLTFSKDTSKKMYFLDGAGCPK